MQEILYGPTLAPYLLAELIGKTLLEKVGVRPHLVLTEQPELLELREHVAVPVAYIADDHSAPAAESTQHDSAGAAPSGTIRLGRQVLRFHPGHGDDTSLLENRAAAVPADANLREPFERVREALNETAANVAAGRPNVVRPA